MTDALSYIVRQTRTRWRTALFGFVFLFPILGYLVSRILRNRWWFCDFDALMCGARTLAQGVSPYGLRATCEGMDPAPFVYAPQVAQAFAPVIATLGSAGSRWLCLVLIIPTLAVLAWWAVLRPFPNAPWQLRLMTLAAMAGSVLACGNIGLMLHAAVILAATQIRSVRWGFIALVVIGALIKPVFLTYLIVLLYEDRPLWARLRTGLVAGLTGVAAVALIYLTAGDWSDEWHAALDAVVMTRQPGIGYFAFTRTVGLEPASWLTLCGLPLFAVIVAGAGFILVELNNLTRGERIMLGLGFAQLLNPRIMDYDMMLLAPMIATVIMLARPLGERFFMWVSWIFAGTLMACVVINIAEIEHIHRAPVAVFIYCGLVIAVAAMTLWQRRGRLAGFRFALTSP